MEWSDGRPPPTTTSTHEWVLNDGAPTSSSQLEPEIRVAFQFELVHEETDLTGGLEKLLMGASVHRRQAQVVNQRILYLHTSQRKGGGVTRVRDVTLLAILQPTHLRTWEPNISKVVQHLSRVPTVHHVPQAQVRHPVNL